MEEAKDSNNPLLMREQVYEQADAYRRSRGALEMREKFVQFLQANDCGDVFKAVLDRDALADLFVLAANWNHDDILESFMTHGMNVNVKDADGWPALIYANNNGGQTSTRLLLAHDADVNIRRSDGYTPLLIFCGEGDVKVVELLLEKNANVDLAGNDGWTPLMTACENEKVAIVRLLLDRNVDVTLQNNSGKTAMDLTENEEIKEMLRNHVSSIGYVLK